MRRGDQFGPVESQTSEGLPFVGDQLAGVVAQAEIQINPVPSISVLN
jgi:hypothetical protein